MQVALVGGGIGGLMAALALHRAGIDCRVFESSLAYEPLGVGLSLRPQGVRVLAKFGLKPELIRRGVEIKDRFYFDRHGVLVYREPCGAAVGNEPYLTIHRADLHEILLNSVVERLGCQAVTMGYHCTGFEQDGNGVAAHFLDVQSGRREEVKASILVGCDGLHSVVRRRLFPNEAQPIQCGITSWRGVARGQPFLSGTSLALVGTFDKAMVTAYPIRNYSDGSQLINLVASLPNAVLAHPDFGENGTLDDFIDHFREWAFGWIDVPTRFAQLNTIMRLPLVDRDPLDQWTFGRVTLLGDAAHPMSPRGGNGAVQSIIDAAVLGEVLAAESDANTALQRYETLRRTATNEIVQTNRENPPDTIINAARRKRPRSGGFGELADQTTFKRISENYRRLTGETMQ